MAKIVRDASHLESTVGSFVDAANAAGDVWKKALGLLSLNGSVMVLSEISSPVLVSLSGKTDGALASLSLIQGRATTAFAPFVSSIVKAFVPGFASLAKDREVARAVEKGDDGKVMLAMMSTLKETFENFDLSKKLIQSGFTFSDMIVVMIFQTLARFREEQVHAIASESEYEELILLLRKLNVASPRLQVGICSNCANYQLVISKHSPYLERCQQCGNQWTSITLYTLDEQLSKLKVENSDLPVFISAYLRNKLSYLGGLQEVKVHPNAVIQVGRSKQEEIDVFVPEFHIAFECKVYRDPFGSFTGPHAGGITGDLRKKIVKLSELGVTDVVVVTNLTDEATKKLTEELLSDESVKIRMTVLSRRPEALIASLDAIVASIGQQISHNFAQQFDQFKAKSDTKSSQGSQAQLPSDTEGRKTGGASAVVHQG